MKRLFLLPVLLVLGCSRQVWHAPLVLDTTASLLPALPAGKYKFTGPVTFTLATAPGAVATSSATDNRKAGQKGGAAATAPEAVASARTQRAGVPWWVFGLAAVAGAALWAWLSGKLGLLSVLRR